MSRMTNQQQNKLNGTCHCGITFKWIKQFECAEFIFMESNDRVIIIVFFYFHWIKWNFNETRKILCTQICHYQCNNAFSSVICASLHTLSSVSYLNNKCTSHCYCSIHLFIVIVIGFLSVWNSLLFFFQIFILFIRLEIEDWIIKCCFDWIILIFIKSLLIKTTNHKLPNKKKSPLNQLTWIDHWSFKSLSLRLLTAAINFYRKMKVRQSEIIQH